MSPALSRNGKAPPGDESGRLAWRVSEHQSSEEGRFRWSVRRWPHAFDADHISSHQGMSSNFVIAQFEKAAPIRY